MRPSSIAHAVLAGSLLLACTDSSGYSEPGPRPRIVKAAISGGSTVNCAPVDTGGACSTTIEVTFRLPEEQFVTTGVVRFQRDGSDRGVDRFYPVKEARFGAGEGNDAAVAIEAAVPPNLLGSGAALLTLSVRLVTGLGEQSEESTLTLTVTNVPTEELEPEQPAQP